MGRLLRCLKDGSEKIITFNAGLGILLYLGRIVTETLVGFDSFLFFKFIAQNGKI